MYTIYINNTLPPALAVHEIYRDIFGPPMVQLYISLPDNIFEVFLQNHSLVPLTFCTINHKRWYNFSTRHSRETLLQGNTKDVEKYRYFSCIKNPKNLCLD